MRSLLLFVFGLTFVCCDELFVAGDFQGSNPVSKGQADYLVYDQTQAGAGTHEPYQRSPISGHGLSGDYQLSNPAQMSGGRFAWISGGGSSVSVSEGAQVWYNLGLQNGYFGIKTVAKLADGRIWASLNPGGISTIAASGDYVAVCGTFNVIGDLSYGKLITANGRVDNPDNTQPTTSVAIFNVPAGNSGGFEQTNWKFAWATNFNNDAPVPPSVSCSSLKGFGTQGNFLINVNSGWTMQIKPDASMTTFAGSQNFGYTLKSNIPFKFRAENVYALALNIEGANANQIQYRISRRGSSDSAWQEIVELSSTTSQVHKRAANTELLVSGLGNKITDFEPDCDGNIYAKFASGIYQPVTGQDIFGEGFPDHYGEYIFRLPSASKLEKDFEIISNDRFLSAKSGGAFNIQTSSSQFAINYNPGTNQLLVSGLQYTLQTIASATALQENPELKYNTPPLAYTWHVDPQKLYERDGFVCKDIKQLSAYNSSTSRFQIAFGGGFNKFPNGNILSLCGDSKTYFLSNNLNADNLIAYNWYTPRVIQYDSKTKQWQKFQILPEGVDQECGTTNEHTVTFVEKYKDGYIVAGTFRRVGYQERFSLFWISKDGKTVKSYPVRNTITSSAGDRYLAYKVPGSITTALLKGDWLFVAGTFDWVEAPKTNGMSVRNIAVLNLKEEKWYSMQSGSVGTIKTLMWNDGRLFIGGSFTKMGEILTSNVATFKPQSSKNYTCCFESINHGVDATVEEFALSSEWGDGIFAFGTSLDPSGSVSSGLYVAKYNGKYWEALDQHWRKRCDETKQCQLPGTAVSKPYVMNKKAYFPDTLGFLYEFDGARFRKLSDFPTNAAGPHFLGNMGNGNLVYWGSPASANDRLSYINVEWDQKKQNMVPSKAGIDVKLGKYWTTRTDSKIAAGAASSFGPILSFVFVAALVILL